MGSSTREHAPVRLAVAGFGLIGRRHVEAIALARGAEIAAIVEPDDAARAAARALGLPCHASLDALFAADRPDGVILATPTPLHAEQGLACVARGAGVLVEKPVATTVAAARPLVEAAEAAGVPLLVGHHRRHNPLVAKAHEMILAGAIGDIRAVHAICWFYKPDSYFDAAPWRKRPGAGPISVNLVHDVDLLRHLCGEIVGVQAQAAAAARGYDNEDVAAAVLRFDSGAIGTITVSDSIAAPWSWELTARENPAYPATSQSCYQIGGSRGALSLPDLRLWTHPGAPDWWSPISATAVPCPASDPLVTQIEHFAAVLAGTSAPLVTGREGLKSLAVVEAIAASAATGAAVALSS